MNSNFNNPNVGLRIVMVGKTGSGKSATGNTILGRKFFESKFSSVSMTINCSKGEGWTDGQKVAIIDTPGLFDTRYGMDKTIKDVSQCIKYACPGPHVFLVVIRLDRYTEEEKQSVKKIQEIFGQAADRYSMVLFTWGDLLEKQETTIESFLADSPDLQQLVATCNGLYHVFNNDQKQDRSQVTELLQKIQNLVQKNGGSHYTNQMFQEAERALEEEKRRILKEKEEQIRKEREKIEREVQKKFKDDLKKIEDKLAAEREKEKKEREEERKRMKEEMDENMRRMREEREAERIKVFEEKEKALINMMNETNEARDRALREEREMMMERFETMAREQAEKYSRIPPIPCVIC